ncbi:anaphase control protein cut9 [Hortaea werneckii]|nr:anaphase control protein cut9 [Hortaea werneckii]
MEAYLRRWMQDALAKHQYDSAIYVGDKLLAITNSDSDAFNLAHAHFDAGNCTRALAFLARADLTHRSPAAKYLAAHCYVQQGRHEDALALLGDKNPTHLITTTDSARRKLQHLHATNGASKSHSSKAKGTAGRLDRADRSEERDLGRREDLKYEAGMCYLRGLCHAKQNAFDRAKECYKDAVRIDVQCFEAFDQLMKNSLMSPGEEWAFVDSLDFESIEVPPPQSTSSDEERHSLREGRTPATTTTTTSSSAEAADFTRNLYLTRLSKYSRPEEFTTAIETLSTHYSLSSNPDILLARAELLSTLSQPSRALALTTRILSLDPYNFPTIPLHISLLYQANHTTALFALAHDLAQSHPQSPTTWLAVGTYYLLTSRIPEARSYFSKSSLLDPQFGPAWIGFAHTFAAEGESDQAIAAYSTAARLFQGTHLPQMFLGMQELALENLVVAREYLTAAWGVCERDPVLVNEMGVCWFKEGEFGKARRGFELGLRILEEEEDGGEVGEGEEGGVGGVGGGGGGAVSTTKAPDTHTPTLRLNLAHALRKLGLFRESLQQFDEVIRLGSLSSQHSSHTFSNPPTTSTTSSSTTNSDLPPLFTAKGLVHLELEEYFEATLAFHAALAISPQDPLASELLGRALGELEGYGVLGREEEEGVVSWERTAFWSSGGLGRGRYWPSGSKEEAGASEEP